MKLLLLLFIPFTAILVWVIGHSDSSPKLFRRLPSSETGILFNNRIRESDSVNVLQFEYLYNGGGVGIGDFNNDGLQDIFFTGNQVSSRLYLNNGNTQSPSLRFDDVTESAGIATHVWCTGVTVVDINADGWQDIYISVAGFGKDTTQRANLLFINQTKQKGKPVVFKELAKEYGLNDMGYSTQTAFFDYDHDGDLDAYVLTNALDRYNRNALRPKMVNGEAPSNDRLYRNNGRSVSGHPVFENVTCKAGILTEGYGLGIAVSDLNGDGWEDVYCANDFLSNDLVWINNQNGTFSNRAADYLKHQTHNAMGVDIADFNNDRLPDIMVVDMLPYTNERQKMMLPGYNYDRFKMDLKMGYQPQYMRNTLQLNTSFSTQSGGVEGPLQDKTEIGFSEISQLAGVDKTDWSWAPLFADFDNDGYRDLFITNGYRRDVTNLDFTAFLADLHAGGFGELHGKSAKAYQQLLTLPEVKLPDFCFRNQMKDGNLTFEDVSGQWGFEEPNFSNGAAYADLDNDGDLDLVINAIDDEAFVYENTLNEETQVNSWLRVRFDKNPSLGTKVNVYAQGKVQTAEYNPTRGYVSSVEPYLHFGLGEATALDSVEVIWNNGQYQVLKNVQINQRLLISYRPTGVYAAHQLNPPKYFQEISAAESGLDYVHIENEFNDFSQTPLLPFKHSQNGPPMAVADVDGNGLEDVYIGSDFGQKSYLYLQQANGHFKKSEILKNNNQEDTGSLFFDADNDGDSDLYVVSGGSHVPDTSSAYQDRLYINDGKGHFLLSKMALPSIKLSGSCVEVTDFDQDGDLDLFRGSRINPGNYPLPVKSFLLKNENGRFIDVTEQIAPELQKIGLVTSATWGDFNRDGLADLALCGEWMPVTVLQGFWKKGQISNVTAGKEQNEYVLQSDPRINTLPTGWWNTLIAKDFDKDGDLDLMVGNQGLNTKYKASSEYPFEIFAADFDKNGTNDPIMTHYHSGKKWLWSTRDLLTFQIPSMKRRFSNFKTYANATFSESFSKEEIQSAYHVSCTELRTMYFENTGNSFIPHALPQEIQFAPVYGILTGDFNRDGHPDALLTGNTYASETIGGWHDASKGTLLLGNGNGGFKVSPNTGLVADKEAKSITKIHRKDKSVWVLIGNNGERLQVFQRLPAVLTAN